MCVSVCVRGVEGGGLGVEEVKEPKPQNMIREKESVLYADEGKKRCSLCWLNHRVGGAWSGEVNGML